MSWQDFVYTIGNVIFVAALIPSIRSQDKPAIRTSLITAITLVVFAFTSFTLELYFTSVVTLIGASFWAILAYQKHSQKK